jgi:hypothetical protein
MNRVVTLGTFTGAAAVILAPAAFAEGGTTTTVAPTDLHGWVDASISGGTATYVDGSPAGLGGSSLELKTTADNASKAIYAHPESFKLSDLTSASYWTKQVAATSAGGSASMQLAVDLNGDGTFDTNLVFEPYWQDNSPDAAPVTSGDWQQWQVKDGLFWSSKSYGTGDTALQAGAGGAPFYTLSSIMENYPDAKVMGVGVNVGSYNPDYAIDVDGVELNGVQYNFEKTASSTEPTTPTNKDDCKKDGWKTLSNVDGTMFRNQGQCVSFVASGNAHAEQSDTQTNASLKASMR